MLTKELSVQELRKMKALPKAEYYLQRQVEWIEQCEANGISYTGENGPAIRQADQNELTKLKAKVEKLKRRKS